MGTVLLLIDNSNIFISGKEKYGDPSARFSYSNFEKICAGNDTIVKKIIAGSTPPSNDRFWTQMEEKDYVLCKRKRVSAGAGHTKEKGVDLELALEGMIAIGELKPSRVVLLTGDADFIPIADIRDKIRAKEGDSFTLDVWAFSNSMSPELAKVSDRDFKIDDYQESLVYFQGEDGRTEGFKEHYARIEEEKAAEREERLKAEQKKVEEEKAEEEKKPIEWYKKVGLAVAAVVGGAVVLVGSAVLAALVDAEIDI